MGHTPCIWHHIDTIFWMIGAGNPNAWFNAQTLPRKCLQGSIWACKLSKKLPAAKWGVFVSATRGQIIYRAMWESNAFSSHSRPITPGGFLYDIYCLETGCLCKWRKSSRRFQRWCSCQKSCHVIFLWWIFKKINTGGSCTFAAKFCQRDIPLLVT